MRKSYSQSSRGYSIESLESREMLAANFLEISIPPSSLDGEGNNLVNQEWGSTDEILIRNSEAEYADELSSPAGEDRVSAREISNVVIAQSESIVNDRGLTDMLWVFGQFLDHDITLTESGHPAEAMNIYVPTGDVYFDPFGTGNQTIQFNRSVYEGKLSEGELREQINQITAFIDGSVIYGSTQERSDALREFSGGRLLTSENNLLPMNTEGLENAGGTNDSLFLAGDIRANENIALMSMHTIWVREHNRIADSLADADPSLSDEEIFQTARAIVRAQLQSVTYNEFLPAILGEGWAERYSGYDPNTNPGIANEFSTAAYRFGHTMLSSELLRLNADGTVADEGNIALQDAFFRPNEILENGIESILMGVATGQAQEVDAQVVDDIRNFLFGPPGSGGFDLASLNIQRGRDHGLADYNQTRVSYGLEPVTQFSDITSDPELQAKLQQVYSSVDDIDLWVGGLAEDHLTGSSMGETFSAILTDQFTRLRDGDRFWYQNLFDGETIQQIESTTLADIIERNTNLENLQENVFFTADAQPELLPDRLVISIPHQRDAVRVIVDDGQVHVRSSGFSSTTELLGEHQLVFRGSNRNDNLTFDFRDDSVNQLEQIVINGGRGNDRIRIIGVNAEFDGTLRVNGHQGNDRIDTRNVNVSVTLAGGAGQDRLMGGRGNDRIFGGGGDDQLLAGAGNDRMAGGRGNDLLRGQGGVDQVIETIAADSVLKRGELRNGRNEVDRLFAMERAMLFTLGNPLNVDSDDFRGRVEVRRRS